YDWSVIVSAGPFDLAPGESVFVAVLIVGGNNLADLENNSDDGQEQYDGTPGVEENTIRRGKAPVFALYQNSPNPFSSGTRIQFNTPDVEKTSLTIFDVAGRVIKTLQPDSKASSSSSRLSISWDGTDLKGQRVPSGIYFYRLTCSGRTTSRKMVIAR
ncbi:T9SS type A sorting domain-containing protein, partial [candidate division TA06 bacterium]